MTAPLPDQEPKRLHLWPSRHIGMLGFASAGLIAATLLFLIGTAVRLSFGPISLGPSIGALSGALREALPPGIVMKYDQAAIEWSREEGRVSLAVLGTEVYNADGKLLIRAPKADIDVAALPLLHGRFEVQRIALVDVQLTLVRGIDGAYRLGIGNSKADRALLKQFLDTLSKTKGPSTLKSFSVRRADLTVIDEETGLKARSTDAAIRLTSNRKDENRIDLGADVTVAGRNAKLHGQLTLPPSERPAYGKFVLDVAPFATTSHAPASGRPLQTRIVIVFAQTAAPLGNRSVMADIAVTGAGKVHFAKADVDVQRLDVQAHYDGSNANIELRRACLTAQQTHGCLSGRMQIGKNAQGQADRIDIDIALKETEIALPQLFTEKVLFHEGNLKGAWFSRGRQLNVETLRIAAEPFELRAAGTVTFPQKRTPGIALTGAVGRMEVRDLVRYWPVGHASGARAWIANSMPTGTVGPAAFTLNIPEGALAAPALQKNAVDVSFPITDASADYVSGLTPLVHASGKAELTGTDFSIDVAEAKVGTLTLAPGRFYIPNINAQTSIGKIDVRLSGSITELLKQINKKPLRYPSRFGIDPNAASGLVAVDLHMNLPLRRSVTFDEISVQVRAAAKKFSMALGPTLRLTDGDIVFNVTNTDLHAIGTTGIGGSSSRLSVDWTEDFDLAKKATTLIAVKGQVDETARRGLGLSTDGYLKGPVIVSGTLSGHGGNLRQGLITLDMTPASLTVARTGIAKPAGFPLTGHLALVFSAHSNPAGANLHLTGAGTEIAAAATFDGNGALATLQIPTFRFGAQNDFSLSLARTQLGTDVFLHAAALDGTHLTREGNTATPTPTPSTAARETGAPKPFHLTANIDRLILRQGVAVTNMRMELGSVGDRIAGFRLAAVYGKNAKLTGGLTRSDTGRELLLRADDAGTLLAGLYGFASMRAGAAELKAQLTADAAARNGANAKGTLVFKNFRIVDQPFLTRLFSAGSLGGLVNLMQGQGIAVDDFELPYTLRERVIEIHDARATGPAVGLTADGYIDQAQNRVAFKGTLVPLYTLNSILGNIPLLGDVLTSKAGEGIIGMSYSIKGNMDEPSIDLNPLSVLAPGIFRRLFEGKMPKASPAANETPPIAPRPKPAQ